MLERWLGLHKIRLDDLMTIIYTSGSTGKPKGVMLTTTTSARTWRRIEDNLQLGSHERVCGILPLFHSMGFTIGMWAVLDTGVKGAYHFSPLDAKVIGKMCQEHDITIIVTTPTFLRSYLRRCTTGRVRQIESGRHGSRETAGRPARGIREKFGIRPMEGYGTTELSPVVSVNVPPERNGGSEDSMERVGTVGRPIPGVQAKIVDIDTGEDCPSASRACS